MTYFTYIMRCEGGRLYTGYTCNLKRRVVEHQNGRGGRFTRIYKPMEVVYFEEFWSRRRAIKREREIKRLSRAGKMRLIESFRGGRNGGKFALHCFGDARPPRHNDC